MEDWFIRAPWLTIVGIVWDLSGAYALARGTLFASPDRIRRQNASTWGTNPAMARARVEQTLEARLGFAHLLIGFGLQLASALGLSLPASIALWALLPLAVHWLYFRSEFQDQVVERGLQSSVTKDAAESTWRQHYDDVPDLVWRRALTNSGVVFDHKTPPSA